MSTSTMVSSLFASSEMLFGAIFLLTILIGGALMYVFSFRQSNDDPATNDSSRRSSKSKSDEKVAKKAKKSTVTKPLPAQEIPKKLVKKSVELVEEEVKQVAVKKATKQSAPVATTTKTKKSVEKVQLKTKEVVAPKEVPKSTSEPVDTEPGWITVVDKKQKKSLNDVAAVTATAVTETSQTNASPKQSKSNGGKKKENVPQVVEQVVADVKVEEEDNDWIPANSKTSKKNVKSKPASVAAPVVATPVPEVAKVVAPSVEVKTQVAVAQEVAAPKVDKKKAAKKEPVAVAEEKVTVPKTTASVSKSLSPDEIQAAINNIINMNTVSSAAASASSDINNNNNTKAKTTANKKTTAAAAAPTTSVPLSVSDVIEASIKKTSNKSNPIVNLKQTNLSESMILIEKDNQLVKSQIQSSSSSSTSSQQQQASGSSSKLKSNRTESNQSSSDSLQDVEGDVEGFITITNKKSKKPVRREQ